MHGVQSRSKTLNLTERAKSLLLLSAADRLVAVYLVAFCQRTDFSINDFNLFLHLGIMRTSKQFAEGQGGGEKCEQINVCPASCATKLLFGGLIHFKDGQLPLQSLGSHARGSHDKITIGVLVLTLQRCLPHLELVKAPDCSKQLLKALSYLLLLHAMFTKVAEKTLPSIIDLSIPILKFR